MSDLHSKLQRMLEQAAEHELTAQLATDRETRAKFEGLARHYREIADQLRGELVRTDAAE